MPTTILQELKMITAFQDVQRQHHQESIQGLQHLTEKEIPHQQEKELQPLQEKGRVLDGIFSGTFRYSKVEQF